MARVAKAGRLARVVWVVMVAREGGAAKMVRLARVVRWRT